MQMSAFAQFKRRIIGCLLLLVMGMILCRPFPALAVHRVNVGVCPFPPLIFNQTKGFSIELLDRICTGNKLEPVYRQYPNQESVVQAVLDGECDIGAAGIALHPLIERKVNYSLPHFESGLAIAVMKTNNSSGIAGLMSLGKLAYLFEVLGITLVFFMIGVSVIAHIIWLVERNDQGETSFAKSYRKGVVDAYWWAIVTMTTVGYGDKTPARPVGKLVAAVWMIIGIVWFASLTATLSSAFTMINLESSSVRELSDLTDKRVGILSGSAGRMVHLYNYLGEVVYAATAGDLENLLMNGKVEAVIHDVATLKYLIKDNPAAQIVGQVFARQQYAMIVNQENGHFLEEVINTSLLEIKHSGAYQELYDQWF